MEDAYAGMMGYSVWKSGDQKHQPTHKILTNEEYANLLGVIRQKEAELETEKARHEAEKNDILSQAKDLILDERDKVAEISKQSDDELYLMSARVEEMQALRDSVLRINREKTNAARKLMPKKKHSGYVLVNYEETFLSHTVHDPNERKKAVRLTQRMYKTTLETPYKLSLTIEELDPEVLRADKLEEKYNIEFPRVDYDPYVRYMKGLDHFTYTQHDYVDMDEAFKPEHRLVNYVFRRDWKSGKNGYWEIVLWHTLPFQISDRGELIPNPANGEIEIPDEENEDEEA